MNDRIDVFSSIHKGIRYAMSQLMFRLGNIDFENDSEITIILNDFNNLWGLLHFHALSEDDFVFPYVKKGNLKVFEDLEKEHEKFGPIMVDIEQKFKQLENENNNSTVIGQELAKAYNAFLVEYFSHLQHEENYANPVLWNVLTDEKILEIGKKSQANANLQSNFKQIQTYFFPYYLKAINNQERLELLLGMKSNMPGSAFQYILEETQTYLDKNSWNYLVNNI